MDIFQQNKIDKLVETIKKAKNIIITAHTNPDGDAIGSSLALLRAIPQINPKANATIITPNKASDTIKLADHNQQLHEYMANPPKHAKIIAQADLIFILDYNDPTRLDKMGQALTNNTTATKILVDHHLEPTLYDLNFHTTQSSSTALIMTLLLQAAKITLTKEIAEPLYLGMMTDTGRFMHSNLTPQLYCAIADTVEAGANPTEINQWVYNNQTIDKIKLTGHITANNLTIIPQNQAAIMTLSLDEKNRFNHKTGDTDGIVNIPLSVKGINVCAMVIENQDHLKISMRSIGDIDVNQICKTHFQGGGHKNASGGKTTLTIEQTTQKLKEIFAQIKNF